MFNEKILVYILITVVIIGGTMFGLSTTDKLQKKEEQVILNKFLLDMDKYVTKTKDKYGNVQINKFNLPKSILEVCFIDVFSDNSNLTEIETHPIILESVQGGVMKNLFLIKDDEIESFYNPNIRLNDVKTFCHNTTDHYIDLKFTGLGNATLIELN